MDRQLDAKGVITKAYDDVMKTPYNYLIIDLTPEAEYQFITRIFPGQDPVVYLQ
jgi:hypothetical protein